MEGGCQGMCSSTWPNPCAFTPLQAEHPPWYDEFLETGQCWDVSTYLTSCTLGETLP